MRPKIRQTGTERAKRGCIAFYGQGAIFPQPMRETRLQRILEHTTRSAGEYCGGISAQARQRCAHGRGGEGEGSTGKGRTISSCREPAQGRIQGASRPPAQLETYPAPSLHIFINKWGRVFFLPGKGSLSAEKVRFMAHYAQFNCISCKE